MSSLGLPPFGQHMFDLELPPPAQGMSTCANCSRYRRPEPVTPPGAGLRCPECFFVTLPPPPVDAARRREDLWKFSHPARAAPTGFAASWWATQPEASLFRETGLGGLGAMRAATSLPAVMRHRRGMVEEQRREAGTLLRTLSAGGFNVQPRAIERGLCLPGDRPTDDCKARLPPSASEYLLMSTAPPRAPSRKGKGRGRSPRRKGRSSPKRR